VVLALTMEMQPLEMVVQVVVAVAIMEPQL
jgi:hypothetical protein